MAKKSKRGLGHRVPVMPQLKLFRPASWYEEYVARTSDYYCAHLLTELGRLGLRVHDIERHDRPPNTETVLSDLLSWLAAHPGKAYGQLTDWRALDLAQMRKRLDKNMEVKPRIELSAEITKMNNLTVRWHPGGWRDSEFNRGSGASAYSNLVPSRRWKEPPDFQWFTGDEDPDFDSRPSNELMFIRGVGNLCPEPVEAYGPYATFNGDVVDSILICAVRTAYEALIVQLANNFEVTVLDAFDFVTRDKSDSSDDGPFRSPIHRVIAWELEDAATLKARREREQADRRLKEDLATLDRMEERTGLTPESFVNSLVEAGRRKRTGPAPNAENINRNAAKSLRAAGHNLDAGQVRHLRQLIELYRPNLLPDELRPAPKSQA